MSTHDYILANQVGSDARVDLNLLFQAIVSQNSSATAPTTMYAYMFWADTTTGILKQRNAANSAWVSILTLSTGATTANALLAGSSTQVFSVAAGTTAANAARIDHVSLLQTVASATTPDIFGAGAVTIDYTGTTTATGFAACTPMQTGSKRTIIPATGASFTASASFVIDGATSGTYLMPAGALVEVIATTTTTFKVTTIFASGTWLPEYELATPGTSSFGTYAVQTGRYTKVGNTVTAICYIVAGTFSLGTGSGSLYIKGLPYTCAASSSGAVTISQASAYVTSHATHGRIAQSESRALLRTSSGSGSGVTNIDAANCGTAMRTEILAEYFVWAS